MEWQINKCRILECTPHAPREVAAARPHAEREEYDSDRFADPMRVCGWMEGLLGRQT